MSPDSIRDSKGLPIRAWEEMEEDHAMKNAFSNKMGGVLLNRRR